MSEFENLMNEQKLTESFLTVHCNEKRVATHTLPSRSHDHTKPTFVEGESNLRRQHYYTSIKKICQLGALGVSHGRRFCGLLQMILVSMSETLGDRSAHRQLTGLGCICMPSPRHIPVLYLIRCELKKEGSEPPESTSLTDVQLEGSGDKCTIY